MSSMIFVAHGLLVAAMSFGLRLIPPLYAHMHDLAYTPMVEEPPHLGPALAALPARPLAPGELRDLLANGVVHIPGLLPDRKVLADLQGLVRPVTNYGKDRESWHRAWPFNGGVRALVNSATVGVLAATAGGHMYNASGPGSFWTVSEAPVWGRHAGAEDVGCGDVWHADSRLPAVRAGHPSGKQVNVWVALTDASHPVAFVAGSHRNRPELEDECGYEVPGGVDGFRVIRHGCVQERFVANRSSGNTVWSTKLEAGDAVVWHANTLHRGCQVGEHRVGVALRYMPFPSEAVWPGCPEAEPRYCPPPESLGRLTCQYPLLKHLGLCGPGIYDSA